MSGTSATQSFGCSGGEQPPVGIYRGGSDRWEELLERLDGDASTHRGVDIVEQSVEHLLGVPECALVVRVVTPPRDVAVPAGRHGSYAAHVVLEGDVDLRIQDFAGERVSFGRTTIECCR